MRIMVLKGSGQISAVYAVVPALITVAFSVILAVDAKDYVKSLQK